MPLIKPRTNRVRVVRHICRLQEPNRDALVHYARFIGDTVDYVLNQLVDSTLLKDRDFLAWRAEQPAVSAVILKSRDEATAPFRRMLDAIAILGVLGAIVAGVGSFWAGRILARGLQRR